LDHSAHSHRFTGGGKLVSILPQVGVSLTEHSAKQASLEPWFKDHLTRDVYLSLLHLESPEGQKAHPVPDSVLKAALLRRATEDVARIFAIRAAKPPLGGLVQGGHVGDDLWQSCLRAEKEIEDEVKDVVNEVRATAKV
jgi:translocation protein SEC66